MPVEIHAHADAVLDRDGAEMVDALAMTEPALCQGDKTYVVLHEHRHAQPLFQQLGEGRRPAAEQRSPTAGARAALDEARQADADARQ